MLDHQSLPTPQFRATLGHPRPIPTMDLDAAQAAVRTGAAWFTLPELREMHATFSAEIARREAEGALG